MRDLSVDVFAAGEKRLLAIVPVKVRASGQGGQPASDAEIIAEAMCALRETRRFSNREIESFRYKINRTTPAAGDPADTDARTDAVVNLPKEREPDEVYSQRPAPHADHDVHRDR
ncbi:MULTISPECIES: hypothetical protein [unclassified Shinella]|jgi:hypothetical protein|uniref:hypothetical protein n=1 Tax=unclassified Shinella TaxID=2643062 RepID=UPI00234F28A4|nr:MULTISPECIES: hypothetical protein [unclassified Shinella]MDC7264623.1 hypothetical protein [Shinella sp. HY16]MDC7271520.1 hypothetical protein [Shinella sp. YZ44]